MGGIQTVSIDYIAAKDEVFGIVSDTFAAVAPESFDPVPALYFPGTLVAPPDPNVSYAICGFSVVTEKQSALASLLGVSIYETVALMSFQFYTPRTDVAALRKAETVGSAIKDAFRKASPSGEIWFRDQKLANVAGNETRNQVNVTAVCTYKTEK